MAKMRTKRDEWRRRRQAVRASLAQGQRREGNPLMTLEARAPSISMTSSRLSKRELTS